MTSARSPLDYGAQSDWIGIHCTGKVGQRPSCAYDITADTVAGSNVYVIHGHAVSSADIGKLLQISCSNGVASGTSLVGAGGNSDTCQPLLVQVSRYDTSNNSLTGTTVSYGSSSASAGNTVTGAQANMGSNNTAAFQEAVNAGDLHIPAGRYVIFRSVVPPSYRNIECDPGAELYNIASGEPNAEAGGFGPLFQTVDSNGVGFYGCTFYEMNTWYTTSSSSYSQAYGSNAVYLGNYGGSNIVEGNTFFHIRADGAVQVTGESPYQNNNNVIKFNSFFGPCAIGGANLISGAGNMYSHNYHQDCGDDVEPNFTSDGNSIDESDQYLYNQYDFDLEGSSAETGVAVNWFCGSGSLCPTTSVSQLTANNNYFDGPGAVQICDGNTSAPNIRNNTYVANAHGHPANRGTCPLQ